ncbi:hypothetical protein CA267_009580 [Alteromonas pelagimontana]|uniref:Uncharacterized protein n=1 Tax=Alteromonas pelagimontana TaxID=1858656 RepID=A0A6M4MD43_9ALTE|nr:hypothetical protein [Alteromonas pelagimontana]QJR81009.1 hypothetical protein CA267_009580 [Alteromonas pelagimontana]
MKMCSRSREVVGKNLTRIGISVAVAQAGHTVRPVIGDGTPAENLST